MHRFYRIKIKIAPKLTVFRHTKTFPFFIENVEMDKKIYHYISKVGLQKNHYGLLNIE